jgi:general stress protein 26
VSTEGSGVVVDYEDVRPYALEQQEREQLLAEANECSFVWCGKDGWPLGVTMSFVWRRGRVWLTTSAQRQRVRAIRRDPRVSVIVSSSGLLGGPGRTATIKGRAVLHDDRQALEWMLPELARAVFPDLPVRQQRFVALLDSPNRVVIEVVPEGWVTHDVSKLARAASASRRQSNSPAD